MEITVTNDQDALPVDGERLEREVATIAARAGFGGDLSVALVSDVAIRELNRKFLDHDYVTDVLAFPLSEEEGEVVVSAERALEEAGERGVEPLSELMLYVAHGVLHLSGRNDEEPEEARRMQEEAVAILRDLGYENE